jgi:hypothetical protein
MDQKNACKLGAELAVRRFVQRKREGVLDRSLEGICDMMSISTVCVKYGGSFGIVSDCGTRLTIPCAMPALLQKLCTVYSLNDSKSNKSRYGDQTIRRLSE